MNKLSGYVCVRNGYSLDYCWEQAVASLLPVCDEVVVCVGSDSNDGTLQAAWSMTNPKVRVVIYPWDNPTAKPDWWTAWLNFARLQLRHEMQITLDADEVLDDSPECHAAIREAVEAGRSVRCDRLNFARDARSLIPENEAVGKWVARIGPSSYHMPSDEPHGPGEVLLLDEAATDPRIRIFHLGFLRRPEAFYAKARVVLGAFFGSYDPRLEEAQATGRPPLEKFPWWDRLTTYNGNYPKSVRDWMVQRGYEVP